MWKLRLNFLNLFSVFCKIFIYLLITKYFGVTHDLDIIFSSMQFVTYGGSIVQMFYSGFQPYYGESIGKKEAESNTLYSTFLNYILIVGGVLICLIAITVNFIIPHLFTFHSSILKFYTLMSIVILLQNIDLFHRIILNLHKKFTLSYGSDTIISIITGSCLFLLYPFFGIISLAYATILSYLILLFFQFYLLRKTNVKYSLVCSYKKSSEIIKASVVSKLSTLVYGITDFLILKSLLELGHGVYGAYAIASRIIGTIHSVTVAPFNDIFLNKMFLSIHKISNKKTIYKALISRMLKNVILFCTAIVITVALLPMTLNQILHFPDLKIDMIRSIFYLLIINYIVIVVYSPLAGMIYVFKKYGYLLIGCIIYTSSFFIFSQIIKSSISSILLSLIASQFIVYSFHSYIAIVRIRSYMIR